MAKDTLAHLDDLHLLLKAILNDDSSQARRLAQHIWWWTDVHGEVDVRDNSPSNLPNAI